MAKRALSASSLEVVSAVRAALSGFDLARVRVGCSGGADSLALTLAAQWVVERELPQVHLQAMIVNHQLQRDSAVVATRVAEQLNERNISSRIVAVDVARNSGLGIEAAAREARYEALSRPWFECGAKCGTGAESGQTKNLLPDVVLLGHTLDDQAETVLLGLARGSGTRSLAGMPTSFGGQPIFVRPLLGVRRGTTKQACRDWGIEFWSDPQNEDPAYLRSRIRAEVMPVLAKVLGRSTPDALARTAQLAQADADLLDALASAVLDEQLAADSAESSGTNLARLGCRWLAAQPLAMRSRIVRQWLAKCGVNELAFGHTTSVLALVDEWHGQRGVDLPSGVRVRRKCGFLVIDVH